MLSKQTNIFIRSSFLQGYLTKGVGYNSLLNFKKTVKTNLVKDFRISCCIDIYVKI